MPATPKGFAIPRASSLPEARLPRPYPHPRRRPVSAMQLFSSFQRLSAGQRKPRRTFPATMKPASGSVPPRPPAPKGRHSRPSRSQIDTPVIPLAACLRRDPRPPELPPHRRENSPFQTGWEATSRQPAHPAEALVRQILRRSEDRSPNQPDYRTSTLQRAMEVLRNTRDRFK